MTYHFNKISPTAVFCARMRSKQNIPFSREIVELIDTKYSEYVRDLPDYGDTLTSKSDFIPFIEGRYYSLNAVLNGIKNTFIVELASGLSPRSLEFLNKSNIFYVETELKELVKLKEKIIREIINKNKLNDSNLFFMSINPLKKEDINKIGQFYLKKGKNKKLIIIHEGLLMYFNKKEKEKFRDNIKYLFQNYAKKGVWLTSDFSRFEKKINEPKGKENIRDKISKVTKRDFYYFRSIEEARQFLMADGFRSEIVSNKEVIEKLIEEKGLQFNKEIILESAYGYRVWKCQLI